VRPEPAPARGKLDARHAGREAGDQLLAAITHRWRQVGLDHPTPSCRSLLSAAFGCWRDAAADGTWQGPPQGPGRAGRARYADTSAPRAGDAHRLVTAASLPTAPVRRRSWVGRFAPKGDNRSAAVDCPNVPASRLSRQGVLEALPARSPHGPSPHIRRPRPPPSPVSSVPLSLLSASPVVERGPGYGLHHGICITAPPAGRVDVHTASIAPVSRPPDLSRCRFGEEARHVGSCHEPPAAALAPETLPSPGSPSPSSDNPPHYSRPCCRRVSSCIIRSAAHAPGGVASDHLHGSSPRAASQSLRGPVASPSVPQQPAVPLHTLGAAVVRARTSDQFATRWRGAHSRPPLPLAQHDAPQSPRRQAPAHRAGL